MDRTHLAIMLHEQWKKETVDFLASWYDRQVDAAKAVLRTQVVERFCEETCQTWDDEIQIRRIADETRKSLNLRFCEEGMIRYISRYEILDRRKVSAEYAGKLFDENLNRLQIDFGVKDPGCMTDEQLMRSAEEAKAWQKDDSMKPAAADVNRCVSDLRTRADWTQVVPVCRFAIAFRKGGVVYNLEMLVDEKCNVTLAGLDEFGADVPKRFRLEKMLDVLGGAIALL